MERIIGEFLMEAACGDYDDKEDGFWEFDPEGSVLTFRSVNPDLPLRRWILTVEDKTERTCSGSGKHWGKSVLFGIPHCTQCLQSWSMLGLSSEPETTGYVPAHDEKRLSRR